MALTRSPCAQSPLIPTAIPPRATRCTCPRSACCPTWTCTYNPLRTEQPDEPSHPGHLRRPRPAGAVVLLARRTRLRSPRPARSRPARGNQPAGRVGRLPCAGRRTGGAAQQELRPRGPGRARLFFQQVPEDKVTKNRVHLDVRTAPGLQGDDRMAALQDESDRLVALGATRVRRHEPAPPMSLGFIVMADPEGNEFCLD